VGKLGGKGFVSLGVRELSFASAFFRNIGFMPCVDAHDPDRTFLFDGSLLVQCRFSGEPDAAFIYFSDRITEVGGFLESLSIHPEGGGEIRFQAAGGLGIHIRPEGTGCAELPSGLTLHQMPIDRIPDAALYPNPVCGIFVAFICPVEDIRESIAYWEQLGYGLLETHRGPYPNATLSDGIFHIGLHQTGEMEGSGLLFAAPDMSLRMAHLENRGMLEIRRNPARGRKTYDACILGPDGIRIYLAGF